MKHQTIGYLLFGTLIALLIGTIAVPTVLIYQDSTAESFELRKDEWVCGKTEMRNTVTAVNVVGGKGAVGIAAVPTVYSVCVQYNKHL